MLTETLSSMLCKPCLPCAVQLCGRRSCHQASSFNFGLLTQILCTQFVFVFATGAACVASQAMISAAFSIVKQSIALGCFPQLSVQHVSDKVPFPCAHVYVVTLCQQCYASMWLSIILYFPYSFCAMLRRDYKMAVCVCSHLLVEQP